MSVRSERGAGQAGPASCVNVCFVDLGGREWQCAGTIGQTVMQLAVAAGVDGIEAQCGGACSCATCHVYVDEAWVDATGVPDKLEAEMLDFAIARHPNSRLSCQVKLGLHLDGLRVHVAPN